MELSPIRQSFERRYQVYAWLTLAFNLAVILWGAYVRATGSGAGCGGSWPLCNGDVIPLSRTAETLIEYTHRITSGVALLVTLGLVYFSRRFRHGSLVRKGALASGIFIIIEALIGAGLVLFDLVGGNTSLTRAAASAIHLTNTYLLLASISLTAIWVRSDRESYRKIPNQTWVFIIVAILGMMLIGASGAITALGDTIFPAETLAEGISDELSTGSHFLVRLRVLHPLIALAVGAYILFGLRLGWFGGSHRTGSVPVNILVVLIILQWVAGAVNVLLLAPIWLQLIHLLIADMIWIVFVIYSERQVFVQSEIAQ